MSTQDLMRRWEEALAEALAWQNGYDAIELSERDLARGAGMAIRSNLLAGEGQDLPPTAPNWVCTTEWNCGA